MDEALDLLEASANKDLDIDEADTSRQVEEEASLEEDSETAIDINDLVDSVFNTGRDVASNISDYLKKSQTDEPKSHNTSHTAEGKPEEDQEKQVQEEQADRREQLIENEAQLVNLNAEIDDLQEEFIINKQRLREIEIFADLDELTEEMIIQQKALEVERAELKDKLAQLEDERIELLGQKDTFASHHKSYTKDDFKSFINDHSETLNETASKIGKEVSQEGKRWGRFISERSKSLIDNFNGKDINFSFKIPWIKSVTEHYQLVYPFEGIKNINLEIYNGSVDLVGYEGKDLMIDAEVRFHGNHEEISKAQFEALTTILNEDDSFIFKARSARLSMDATIKVPNKDYHQIYLNLLNGDINLKEFRAENLIIKNKNGDLTITEIQSREADLDLLNGDIHVLDSAVETLVIKNLNGDIRVDGYIENLSAEAINADMFLTKRNQSESNIKVKTVSGDIKVAIPDNFNLNIDAKTISGSVLNRLSNLDYTENQSSDKAPYYHRNLSSENQRANVIISSNSGDIYLKDSQATL